MLTDRLKQRLNPEREMTTITMRIPVDVVESLKRIAPLKGFSGYQTLLKAYISEGLRKDESRFDNPATLRLIDALRKRGVSEEILADAAHDLDAA